MKGNGHSYETGLIRLEEDGKECQGRGVSIDEKTKHI